MKVAVTGGAGFVGSRLVEVLLDAGHHVRVVDDLSSGCLENLTGVYGRIAFVKADVSTREGADRACSGVDAVVHLAARPSVAESMRATDGLRRANLLTTLRILESAERLFVRRVVYASSCAVYAEKSSALAECDPTGPISPYAEAKFAGELAVRAVGEATGVLDTASLRFFNVVGPRQRASGGYGAVVPSFVDSILDGKMPLTYGDGEQSRDFVSVNDVAEALLRAVECPKALAGRVINVGTGTASTVNEVFAAAWSATGGCRDNSRRWGAARQGEMRHARANAVRLWEDLGVRCQTSLTEMVNAYAVWKREELARCVK